MHDLADRVSSFVSVVWPYVVGFLAIISIGDMVGWYQGWRERRGFKITAVIEDVDEGAIPYQMRITFALRGTQKRSINRVYPVVRPRWILWRLVHGGWSMFGDRSRGRAIDATAPTTNPDRDLVVDDPARRVFVFDVVGETGGLPPRWSWPWDKTTESRVPRPQEVKLRCSLSGKGSVYVKPKLVAPPLGEGPDLGAIKRPDVRHGAPEDSTDP